MIHPHTEIRFINQDIGYGVFATEFIPKGTVTWTLCEFDIKYSLSQVSQISTFYHDIVKKYSYINQTGDVILCWDEARYMNHSCAPKCIELGGMDTICIAIEDIQANEQVTCDYGILNLLSDMECRCLEHKCRKTICREDVLHYGHLWEKAILDVIPSLAQVEQLLYPFILDKQEFDNIVTEKKRPSPMKDIYCPHDTITELKTLFGYPAT